MTIAAARRLRLRGFAEGVEIPIIAANIQCAPNSPIVATIQVPPLAEGTRLMPRTLIHLYFRDFYATSNPFTDPVKKTEDDVDRPSEEDSVANAVAEGDARNRDYKLLFVGEVVGFAWTKSQGNRSLVLQCEDPSNYWDYAYQYENSDIFGPGINAIFSGGATNLFTDFLSSKGSVITSIVSSGKCNSYPKLKGLAAGIVRLIEAIGGTYFPRPGSDAKKIGGQNLFFSLAELRLHITGMITAFENDPTSETILQRQGYSGMFERALGGQGGQTSIRQAINALTKIMFHETYAQPCPMYIPGSDGQVSGQKRTRVKGHPLWGFISDEAEKAIAGLNDVKRSLDLASFANEANVKTAVTLAKKKLSSVRADLLATITKLRANPKSKPPEAAKTIFTTAAQSVGVAATKVPTPDQFGAKSFSPKADSAKKAVFDKIDEATSQLQRALDLTIVETASKDIQPARLTQQILRPDIWFGSPPRCNVLFPEHYDTLNYQRMFLQEPTRFLLKTNDEFFGEDFLFDKLYFAPQAGTTSGDRARIQSVLGRELLDHELFTGILPVFEKMGEFNVFAAKSGTAKGNIPKVGLAQRSANFLYFKHRFNARKMQIIGRFNPYIVCGFPGLILDKYVDQQTIALHNELRQRADLPPQEIASTLGTSFLANFTQVTHLVSQAETAGRTEIVCSYGRQVDESVEFLGTLPAEAKVQKKTGATSARSTDVAAVNPPKLFAFGPNLGRITNVQDVTELYFGGFDRNAQQFSGSQELPLFDIGVKPTKKSATLVPVGVQTTAKELSSPDVEAITGGPDVPITFRAFRVTEEVPQYKQQNVLLPAEEYIRPGWYGDCWSPSQIGKVYNDFFATGSITDATTFTGPGGSSLGQSTEEQSDAAQEQKSATDAADPRGTAVGALALDEGSSIQQAVEFLVLSYSFIRQQNLDVDEFIRAYTWRPIATMVDMFGTVDLQFSTSGETAVAGTEGFHSRAFGPYNDLFGLTGPDIEDILGIKRGSTAAQRADTRLRKLQAVQQFVSALRFSRAVLG